MWHRKEITQLQLCPSVLLILEEIPLQLLKTSDFTCGPWLIYGSAAKVIVDHFRAPLFGVSGFVKYADVAEGHVHGTDGPSRLTSQQLLVTGSLGAAAFLFARIRARQDVPGSDDSK